jgi:uncharacterized membrane protein YfcA
VLAHVIADVISHLSLWQWAAVFCGVLLAYIVFGIAGFGTALVAGPLLAQCMPLARIVPLLALLDFTAAAGNLLRDGRQADLGELKRMAPLMVAGSGIGAVLLLWGQPAVLMLVLGLFAIAYALYSLSGYRPAQPLPARASIIFGLVGGVFSALFGSGGFLYAIYLAGRIADKERIRVTQSTLIGLSTLTRLILFAVAGVYNDGEVALTALLLAPAMLLGTFSGRHITLKLTRAQFLALVNVVILVSGLSLLFRYFSSP